MSFFSKLKNKIKKRKQEITQKYDEGLTKSRRSLSERVNSLVSKYRTIDEDYFNELEEILILSDVGFETVEDMMESIKKEIKGYNIKDPKVIKDIIVDKMFSIYSQGSHVKTQLELDPHNLNVILFVGVNGSGKTTSIAKIANILLKKNISTMVAAADTFRAAATEQLLKWSDKLKIKCVTKEKEGQDPASVIYKAIQEAKSNGTQVLLCDTAGRLQAKTTLMNELEKMKRIINREVEHQPIETLLVLDATTGQNGISQSKHFSEVTPITGIILSKIDGTAKGGIVLSIKKEFRIPVKYVGFGEKIDDLKEFDLEEYIYNLTKGLE